MHVPVLEDIVPTRGKDVNRFLKLILAVLLAGCCWGNARAQIYVGYFHAGVVSKYDADSGALISENFILGLKEPRALCLANGVLYVLQSGDGTIGKYDPQTGATINDRFISGLNQPQAMAVAGDTLYVASFDWPAAGGGQVANLIGKYNAVTGAVINYSFVKTDMLAAALAASGQKLFVAGGSQMTGQSVYDTNTGAPLEEPFTRFLNGSGGLTLSDNWLWFTAGGYGSSGAVFKFDVNTGASAVGAGFFHPLISNLNYPCVIAVSGDELFVGGAGTSVSKYNAITGELIKAAFIPDLSDRFGGIAVVLRAPSGNNSWADTKFEAKNTFLNFLFWLSMNGGYLSLASGILVAIVVLGLCAMFFFRSAAQKPELVPVETTPEPTAFAPPDAEASPPPVVMEESAPAEALPVNSRSMSALTKIILGLLGVTLALAAFLAWLASQTTDISHVPQRDTSDLIGIWGFENSTRQAYEMPILLTLFVYSTHIEFSSGHGTESKQGQWRDNGFWCQKPDGSEEVEVARIVSPEELELHVSAFDPGNPTVDVLYKQRGNDAEMQALAVKYPPPITYPPPAGVIKYWMTEYELTSLPWKADHIEIPDDPSYSRRMIYVYRSDNPHLDKLEVTVKNHRVVEIKGGNG
jgi:hypothetical protein